MYGINCLEPKPSIWCWAVGITRRGKVCCNSFYQLRRGGAKKALAEAIAWRDELLKKLKPLSWREFHQTVRSNNRSGEPGVYLIKPKIGNRMFTSELLQAVNDWQRGGDAKQKKRRGEALKAQAASLPQHFKETTCTCYRQIALDKTAVWRMGTKYHLAEGLSAWTTSEIVAREFKGGDPPIGYQGVIFRIQPGTGTVVINLAALFKDKKFQSAIDVHKTQIVGYDRGLRKYAASQLEVVIEADTLPLSSLHSWGGYSSPELKLAEMYFGAPPNNVQLQEFRKLMQASGHACGAYWLTTPAAVKRISQKLKSFGKKLSGASGGAL